MKENGTVLIKANVVEVAGTILDIEARENQHGNPYLVLVTDTGSIPLPGERFVYPIDIVVGEKIYARWEDGMFFIEHTD